VSSPRPKIKIELIVAMSIPVICNLLTFSLRMVAPIKVTHIGLVVTRKVLLEIEMYSKDIIHARK
jgi:hypothetical protein